MSRYIITIITLSSGGKCQSESGSDSESGTVFKLHSSCCCCCRPHGITHFSGNHDDDDGDDDDEGDSEDGGGSRLLESSDTIVKCGS